MKVLVCSPYGGTDSLDIVTQVLQGDTICTKNVNRSNEKKKQQLHTKNRKKQMISCQNYY